MTNKIIFTFLLSIFLYIIFALSFFTLYTQSKTKQKEKVLREPIKVSFQQIQPVKKSKPKVKQPIPKKKKEKKLPPKKYKNIQKKQKKITNIKKVKKIEHKSKKIKRNKPTIIPKKTIIKKPIKPKKEPTLLDILSKDTTQPLTLESSPIQKEIKSLYGNTFETLSKNQQQYILDNMEIMRIITQDVLQRVAMLNINSKLTIETQNIVEFYLHPNGDISDFKFLSLSGNEILDKTTKETIEYAYSKYPHPKEKTLIRYNVYYNLKAY